MKLIYLLYPSAFPRNILQYTLGALLFYLVNNHFSLSLFFLGLAAFLLSYNFVYTLNDLLDYEQDLKNPLKRKFKLHIKAPLVSGYISKGEWLSFSLGVFLIGLVLASFVNHFFLVLILVLIGLNVLHSAPKLEVRKRTWVLVPNMTLMQFLKWSIGWFAQGAEISSLPIFFLLTVSSVYVLSYKIGVLYGGVLHGGRKAILNEKFFLIGMSIPILGFFALSLFLYELTLPLTFLTPIATGCVLLLKKTPRQQRAMRGAVLNHILMGSLILCLLAFRLIIPLRALNHQVNQRINEVLPLKDVYQDTVKEVCGGLPLNLSVEKLCETP
jgi:4-hydroxybenzoate polyprenyltransferase